MNMKKIAALCMAAALAAGALTACGGSAPAANNAANTNTAAQTVEVKEVTMAYITAADACKNLTNPEYVFMDVRKADDYAAGHIPGAINADMDKAKDGDNESGIANMTPVLDQMKDKNVVFICYSGKRYAQAATNVAAALGIPADKMFTLEGGMKQWTADYEKGVIASGATVAGSDVEMKYIPVDEAKGKTADEGYVFVDVRKAADYAAGHIEGAVSADLDAAKGGDIQNGAEKLAAALLQTTGSIAGNGKNIVLICYSGKSYAQAGTNILSAMDSQMSPIFTLEGGMKAWTEGNNPVVK